MLLLFYFHGSGGGVGVDCSPKELRALVRFPGMTQNFLPVSIFILIECKLIFSFLSTIPHESLARYAKLTIELSTGSVQKYHFQCLHFYT